MSCLPSDFYGKEFFQHKVMFWNVFFYLEKVFKIRMQKCINLHQKRKREKKRNANMYKTFAYKNPMGR
jgi:hypothetical protein